MTVLPLQSVEDQRRLHELLIQLQLEQIPEVDRWMHPLAISPWLTKKTA